MEVTFDELFSGNVVEERRKPSPKARRIAKLFKNIREKTLDHIGGSRVALATATMTMATIGMFGGAIHEMVEEARFQKDKFLGTEHVNSAAMAASDMLPDAGVNRQTGRHILSLQNVSPLRDGSVLVEVAHNTDGMTCSKVADAARQATDTQEYDASIATILEQGIEARTEGDVVIAFWQGRPVCQKP